MREKGFYQDQKLNVTIQHASRGEHLQLLMAGEVDFTTAAATSVLKRLIRIAQSHSKSS